MVVVVGHPSGNSLRRPLGRGPVAPQRGQRDQGRPHPRDLCQARAAELPGVRRAPLLLRRGRAPACSRPAASSVGLLICEDAWFDQPAELARESGAEVLAVINASPYHVGKEGERVARMAERARAVGLPLVYAHLVGGQDEVVFDGASFALQADGAARDAGAGLRGAASCSPQLERMPQGEVAFAADPAAHRRAARGRGPALGRTGARCARLHRQERFSGRHPGAFRWRSTPRWCLRSRSMRWGRTRCAR